jgi:hypothetical protein
MSTNQHHGNRTLQSRHMRFLNAAQKLRTQIIHASYQFIINSLSLLPVTIYDTIYIKSIEPKKESPRVGYY